MASSTPSTIAMTTGGRSTSPPSVLSTASSMRSSRILSPLPQTVVPRLWYARHP
jgi:hypothetical protein